jgi:hypothetical protein
VKKIAFYTLAALCASTAMAQDTTTMNFTNGTLNINGCVIGGVTQLSVAGGNVSGSGANVTFAGTCSAGPSTVSVATISPTTQTFTIGTTTVAPSVTITSSDAGVSCVLTGSDTTTYTAAAGGTITFATPTAAGTTTYTAACSTSKTGFTATPSPASVSVTASSAPPPPQTGACDATQKSTYLGSVQLSRQCSGTATFGAYHAAWSGNLYNLTDVLGDASHPGPFPNLISGYTMVMPIQTGNYVSLGFVADSAGQMQFTTDPSYGDGGIITISTTPGAFSGSTVVSGGYGQCIYSYGAANSMWIGMGGADCPLVQGRTYYINFAAVDLNGTQQCFNTRTHTCASDKISYQVVSGH